VGLDDPVVFYLKEVVGLDGLVEVETIADEHAFCFNFVFLKILCFQAALGAEAKEKFCWGLMECLN
jgi:hypothetical protein